MDVRLDRWPNETAENSDRNWEDNAEELHSEIVEDDDRENENLQDEHDAWHDDESHGTEENWQDDFHDAALDTGPIPRIENSFNLRDEANLHNMELRELLSRYFYFIPKISLLILHLLLVLNLFQIFNCQAKCIQSS